MPTISGIVQAQPNATIGGVVQAKPPGTIGTISKLPPPPSLSVMPTQLNAGTYNPQANATGGMLQPAATTTTVMPNTTGAGSMTQPATGTPQNTAGAFKFMDGSGFDANGSYQQSPQFTPDQIATAMHVALNTPPPNQLAGSSTQTPPEQPIQQPSYSPYPPGYDPTYMKGLEQQVRQNTELSPAELQAQQKLNDITASEQFGLTKIEQDPNLVMPLLTGQQQALQHQAENMAVPIQQQLAIAQAKRQASLDASKFALDREDTRLGYLKDLQKPQTLTPGTTVGRFNPSTGSFDTSYSTPYAPMANPLSPTGISTFGTNGQNVSQPGITTFGTGGTFSMGTAPGSAAAVNNPLGIKPGGKFSQFSTPEQGLQAGAQLIQRYQSGTGPAGINGNTPLEAMVNTWINGTATRKIGQGYNADDVAKYLGITSNTPISQIDPQKLAFAIAHFETGYQPGTGSQQQSQNYTGSPIVDSVITQLLNGVPPSQISAQPQVMQLAQAYATQINPSFNPAQSELNYQNQQKAQANAVPLIQAQKTALDHLQSLQTLVNSAGYGNNQIANNLRDWWNNNVSRNQPITDLKSAIGVVRGEVAKVLGGGTATVESLQEAQSVIPDNLSPTMMQSVIQNVTNLMNSKIQEYSAPVTLNNGQTVSNVQGTGAGGSLTIDQIKQAYGINY